MERRKQKEVLLPRYIFCLCVAAVLLYLILGQMLLPNESGVDYADGRRLDVAWVRVQPDQTRENIVLPAKLDAAKGETVVIEATLPQMRISVLQAFAKISIFLLTGNCGTILIQKIPDYLENTMHLHIFL